jgi:ABC-type transport system involved in multi-copper enzyme maturation permease subunit
MIRAVIGDTWQQSKQQAVFIMMLVVMLLALIAGIALPRPIVTADGQKQFGTILSDKPADWFAAQWTNEYAKTLGYMDGVAGIGAAMRNGGANRNLGPGERREQIQTFMQEQQRLRNEAVAKATSVPEYRRGVEYFVHFVVGIMFRVTLLLFIAACAGYFPAMLSSGAVDIVLSKPISRLQIYSARYLGGIALYTAALAAFCALLFIGIGLRTGVYHYRIFYSIPLLAFTAMVLYAVLALIGTVGRSATMAMVTGYVLYVVVDSVIGFLLNLQPVLERMGWESVATVISVLRHVLPNFGMMNDMALASLLNMPKFELMPFAVALAWLFSCLGMGYWIFSKRDY